MNELLEIEREHLFAGPDIHHGIALAETPGVRAAAIARGKALIANPDYPSKAQIKKIANLLAENLSGGAAASPPGSRSITVRVLSRARATA